MKKERTMKKESENFNGSLSRRVFMKGVLAVSAASALPGCAGKSLNAAEGNELSPNPNKIDLRETRKVYSTCPVECLTHSLNCQLVGDTVVRVEPTRKPDDPYFTTACARGMSRMQFLTENRVATPMKRVRKNPAIKNNNEDSFISISWEQALDEIASKLKPLRNDQGVLLCTGSGNMGPIANNLLSNFFSFAAPNRIVHIGNSCCQGADDGMVTAFGERRIDTRDTIKNAHCIICWGNNPATTSNTYWKFVAEAREKNNAEIIVIDPRYSESAEIANQWLPIKPGTDTLVAIGMLRHIFEKHFDGSQPGWIDEEFLKHRTNASYLIDISALTDDDNKPVIPAAGEKAYNKMYNMKYMTDSDGNPCVWSGGKAVAAELNKGRNTKPLQNPDLFYADREKGITTVFNLMLGLYAGDKKVIVKKFGNFSDLQYFYDPTYCDETISGYTGVAISKINSTAAVYASSGKKSMIIQNMGGAMRTENGGHMCALHCILSMVTGNLGEPGNGVDDTSGYATSGGMQTGDMKKLNVANTYITQPRPKGNMSGYTIPFGVLGQRLSDANRGKPQDVFLPSSKFPAGTKDPQLKFLWVASRSLLTQFPNTNALKDALLTTETVVVAKPTWNTDADYCDYFLPVATPFEYNDIGAHNRNKYVQIMENGIMPYGQALSDMQIMRRLAKLVLNADEAAQFDHDDEFYVKDIIENPANNFEINGITYKGLQKEKAIRPASLALPWVPFWNHEFKGACATNNRAKLFITEWQSMEASPGKPAGYKYPRLSPNPAKDLFRGPFPRFVPALESSLPWAPVSGQGWTSALYWEKDFGKLPQRWQDIRNEYDLNCVQIKVARSVHASFTGLPWIRELFGEKGIVMIHPDNAEKIGIKDGDLVTVSSAIGSIERFAMVTSRVVSGVVCVENGWWDKYGPLSSSTIVAELPDPMGCGHTHNNTLVKITKGGLK